MTTKFNAPVEDRNILSYREEARAMTIKFAGATTALIYDEDAITNVASAIAKAEHDFDPGRGVKRSTLRMTYGKHQVWKELRQAAKRREKTVSIDTPRGGFKESGEKSNGMDIEDYRLDMSKKMEEDEEREKSKKMARQMIQCNALTKKQRQYLKLRYVKGISVNKIAKRNKCSKQAVFQVLCGAIRRLKGIYFEGSLSLSKETN